MVTVITVPGQTVDYLEEARRWRQILGNRYLGDGALWKSNTMQFPAGYYSLQGFLVHVDTATAGSAIFLTRTNDGVTARIGSMMVHPPLNDIIEANGTLQIMRSEIFGGNPGEAPSAMELDANGSINGVPLSQIFESDGSTARNATLAEEADCVTHIGAAFSADEINSALVFPNRGNAQMGLVSFGPISGAGAISGWEENTPAVVWVMDDNSSKVFTADRQTQGGSTIAFTSTGFTITGVSTTSGRYAVLFTPGRSA